MVDNESDKPPGPRITGDANANGADGRASSRVGRTPDEVPSQQAAALSIGDLDWDLPDEFDPPSGFDGVMSASDSGSAARSFDDDAALPGASVDLPSTSSIFGSGYRERGATGSVPAVVEVSEGGGGGMRNGAADSGPLSFDITGPISASPPTGTAGAPAPSLGQASGDSLSVLDLDLEEVRPLAPIGDSRESVGVRERVAVQSLSTTIRTPSSTSSDSRIAFATSRAPDAVAEQDDDPIELGTPKRLVGAPRLEGRNLSDSQPIPRSAGETPLVTPRLDRPTPIILSPVVAARVPTPTSADPVDSPPVATVSSSRWRWVLLAFAALAMVGILFALIRTLG